MISENVFSSDSFSSAKKTASPGQSAAPKTDGSDFSVTDYSQAENILSNTAAKVDATYAAEGYVRIAYTGGSTAKIKPSSLRQTAFNIPTISATAGNTRCSLSGGDGTYSIGVYVNKYDTKYSTVFSTKVSVTLKSQFALVSYPESVCQLYLFQQSGRSGCRHYEILQIGS